MKNRITKLIIILNLVIISFLVSACNNLENKIKQVQFMQNGTEKTAYSYYKFKEIERVNLLDVNYKFLKDVTEEWKRGEVAADGSRSERSLNASQRISKSKNLRTRTRCTYLEGDTITYKILPGFTSAHPFSSKYNTWIFLELVFSKVEKNYDIKITPQGNLTKIEYHYPSYTSITIPTANIISITNN